MTPTSPAPPERAAATGPVEEYWRRAAAGIFSVPTCRDCGNRFLPPQMYCPACASSSLGWTDSAGAGEIYSFSVVERTADPHFRGSVPYVIALADLEDLSPGSRLYARLVDATPAEVAVGQHVRVTFASLTGPDQIPVLAVQRDAP